MSGLNEAGQWNTARAKEYPPSLNLAIAKNFADSLDDARLADWQCSVDDDHPDVDGAELFCDIHDPGNNNNSSSSRTCDQLHWM